MSCETSILYEAPLSSSLSRRPPRRRARCNADRLADAVLALSGHAAALVIHTQMPWASITFSGARHTMKLVFSGQGAVRAGEAFIAALPDHEFGILGQLVADAAVKAVESRWLPEPWMNVDIELLMLEDH
ncbi:hypothetical protein RM533_02450 [Croceicoccus sp. F390]|uniref:Uncharacterized protein n=1 Tax=Croceicoccus esteveae TaxID=3075597 RepID=A0ABU2ZI05_9SPHN|nr:hypothetical protein [Croceicoccus sp. F390]MDT0575042.1 hypothetical protein [Croceicoccus sp. F390]